MRTSTVRHLLEISALIALLAACSSPAPRGYAYMGSTDPGAPNIHNTSYYLGADPNHQHPNSKGP